MFNIIQSYSWLLPVSALQSSLDSILVLHPFAVSRKLCFQVSAMFLAPIFSFQGSQALPWLQLSMLTAWMFSTMFYLVSTLRRPFTLRGPWITGIRQLSLHATFLGLFDPMHSGLQRPSQVAWFCQRGDEWIKRVQLAPWLSALRAVFLCPRQHIISPKQVDGM